LSTTELFTLVVRTIAMLSVGYVGWRLFRARKANGELLAAFTWNYLVMALTMCWYIAASLLVLLGLPQLRHYVWEWAWLPWAVLIVTLWRLDRALRGRR